MVGFVDIAHSNKLQKCCSTTGIVHTFCGNTVVYKSKTQSITVRSSTKAEFIAAHTTTKITQHVCHVLKHIGFKQKEHTKIHINNISALHIINNNTSQTERKHYINI